LLCFFSSNLIPLCCFSTRVHYGPDSPHGEFETDSCAVQLGLPTCALWLPDPNAFIKLLTHEAPDFLGGWCLIGIIAASMSTADGAILAMGTVVSHNLMRQLDVWWPSIVTPDNLLFAARTTTLPFTLISTFIAAFYKSSGSAAGATGYLLIVAFDIVLATVVVPLFGAFYCKNPSPRAALVGIMAGVITRVTLEFALPKDGLLLLPYDDVEFLDVGPAASSLLPNFIDAPEADYWDPEAEPCEQETFEDFTGVDSLAAPLCNLFFFLAIQTYEHYTGKALFEFGGSEGYIKVRVTLFQSFPWLVVNRTHPLAMFITLQDTTEHPLKDMDGKPDVPLPESDIPPEDLEPRESTVKFGKEAPEIISDRPE